MLYSDHFVQIPTSNQCSFVSAYIYVVVVCRFPYHFRIKTGSIITNEYISLKISCECTLLCRRENTPWQRQDNLTAIKMSERNACNTHTEQDFKVELQRGERHTVVFDLFVRAHQKSLVLTIFANLDEQRKEFASIFVAAFTVTEHTFSNYMSSLCQLVTAYNVYLVAKILSMCMPVFVSARYSQAECDKHNWMKSESHKKVVRSSFYHVPIKRIKEQWICYNSIAEWELKTKKMPLLHAMYVEHDLATFRWCWTSVFRLLRWIEKPKIAMRQKKTHVKHADWILNIPEHRLNARLFVQTIFSRSNADLLHFLMVVDRLFWAFLVFHRSVFARFERSLSTMFFF